MKKIILITILFISLLSSPSWSETLTMDDLVEKEDLLFYKKFSIFSPLDFLHPFTGIVESYYKMVIYESKEISKTVKKTDFGYRTIKMEI